MAWSTLSRTELLSNVILCRVILGSVIMSYQSGRLSDAAAQQALAADRFAREIVGILTRCFYSTAISIYLGGG